MRSGGAAYNLGAWKKREYILAQSQPQLYRFCFLMTGDSSRAIEAFQKTLREAALSLLATSSPRIGFGLFMRRAINVLSW